MGALKLFSILMGFVLGSAAATQWVAHQLAYHVQLGTPLLTLGTFSFYPPHSFFTWVFQFSQTYPTILQRGFPFVLGGVLLGVGGSLVMRALEARRRTAPTTYGSSRWATEQEIRTRGLFDGVGVILGQIGNHYVQHNGPEHLLLAAPPRTGKGVGIVLPTLLTNTDSVIINDIKGENWENTAGWRSQFSRCLKFNPTSLDSVHYNPLAEIRKGPNEVKDTQNVADMLVDPEGKRDTRDHWEKTGHALLVGAILHILYAEKDKTLAGVATFLADPARSFDETLQVMMTTVHVNGRVHPVVASSARELMNKSPNELSGVLSTALSFLSLYRDPIVAEVTSQSDFTIEDIRNAHKPMSLYLCLPPSDISRTRPLMRLILNQIGRRLTESLDPKKHNLLWILDEFGSLGRLDFFETALGYFAGYGIRVLMVIQSFNQIDALYGTYNSLFDNAHVKIAFAVNDDRTAKRLSARLGPTTEIRRGTNLMGGRFNLFFDRCMESEVEIPRDLLTPSEIMQMPPEDELILLGSFPPIRAKKIRYYQDQTFLDRIRPAPGSPSTITPVAGHAHSHTGAPVV